MLLCMANISTLSVSDKTFIYDIKARFKKDKGGTVKMDATLQNWMQESEEIGEKRGKEEGIMLGKEEGAKMITKTMIEEGLPIELIMRYTGLSEDVITTLLG